MKLKSIKVSNYRQFIESTILYSNDITILAGANNSGKTSLIELIRKIFNDYGHSFTIDDIPITNIKKWADDFYTKLTPILNSNDENNLKISNIIELVALNESSDGNETSSLISVDELSVNIEVTYDKNEAFRKFADYLMDLDDNKQSFYFGFRFTFSKHLFEKILLSNFEQILQRYNSIKKYKNDDAILKIDSFKLFLAKYYIQSHIEKFYYMDSKYELKEKIEPKDFKSLFNVNCINANRMLDDESTDNRSPLSKKMINFVKEDDDWKEMLKSLPEKLITPIEESGIKESIREKSLNSLGRTISSISKTNGGRTEKISLDMDIDNDEINTLLKRITTAKYIVDDHYLKENAQGLGYSNMIFMHLELENYIKNIDYSVVNICIIEEPEAHMHPQMQKIFMNYLTTYFSDKKIQGFVTTHSSEVIKASKIPKIRVIRRIKTFENYIYNLNQFMIDMKSIDLELENFYNLLFNINFSDVIFADKVIMYEGDTERMFIRKILENDSYSELNEQYISFVQVGGAYAHKYKDFISYLKIKCLIITDIDYDKSLHDKNNILDSYITNAAIKDFYSDKNDIEKKITVNDLYSWKQVDDDQIIVKFQTDIDHHSRTLEEAMLSKFFNIDVDEKKTQNEWKALRTESKLIFSIPRVDSGIYVRDIVNASSNNKTDFMYSVILEKKLIEMLPMYIEEGLKWLI